MAKLLEYRINEKLSKYSHLQMIFGTDAGKVEGDDEWLTDRFFNEVSDMMPKGIGVDSDGPGWNDYPEFHLTLHGWNDVFDNGEEDFSNAAVVAMYFDIKTGILKIVETESLEL